MDNLPFSQACENNKAPILEVLQGFFEDRSEALEVASGTGQHACHFAAHMPWLRWQPTEIARHLPVLHPRCEAYPGKNLLAARALDVNDRPWEVHVPDALFTANSLHIMPESAVQRLFFALDEQGPPGMKLAIYGPFNYDGNYTSQSNEQFDGWLAQQNPDSAIRDYEMIEKLAAGAGFGLVDDVAMPANNRLLLWQRAVTAP